MFPCQPAILETVGWPTVISRTEKMHRCHTSGIISPWKPQVVCAGGTISHSIALAELQHQLAQLDKEKNKQDIRFLLVGNYLELYQLHNQAEVYKKNIEQTRRLLEDIKAKQQEGLAIKNDITRYELQLKSLELALIQIENIINNQLVTTLGLPQETLIEADTGIIRELPFLSPESQWQTTANT